MTVATPAWTTPDLAHLDLHRAQQRPPQACDPDVCQCHTLDACMDRHPAGRDLAPDGMPWTMVPTAHDLLAHWSPSGLRLTFAVSGRVQSIRVDEAGMAAIRSELGITRSSVQA